MFGTRATMAAGAIGLFFTSPVAAATLTSTRPGVMCRDANALARLTLPDGSSRSGSPTARPEDLAAKRSGGCLDIPLGIRVTLVSARTNTSVVIYDANDGQGPRRFLIPNVDFDAVVDVSETPSARHVPAWPDADYPPLVSANKLFAAVRRQCPQQGWTEHSLSHTETGPWDNVTGKLSPAQLAAIEKEAAAQCQAGLSCPADIQFGMEVQMGHLQQLVTAICSKKAPPE